MSYSKVTVFKNRSSVGWYVRWFGFDELCGASTVCTLYFPGDWRRAMDWAIEQTKELKEKHLILGCKR